MRIREQGYNHYGISTEEENSLMQMCKRPEWFSTVAAAAYQTNPALASALMFSLANGLSYDRIDAIKPLPISSNDFYGYRRKALATFRDLATKCV